MNPSLSPAPPAARAPQPPTACARFAGEHRFDGVLALGLACVLYGVARIYVPAAWILGGVALLTWAVLGEIARKRRETWARLQDGE